MHTVGDLERYLSGIKDKSMPVVVAAHDHNFVPAIFYTCEAHDQRPGSPEFGEYGGKQFEEDMGPRVEVLYVGA